MRVVYLIGEPGIGKTTLMREYTNRLGPAVEMTKPLAHRIGAGWLELGERRGTFSGTDALSMSVQPLAVGWLRTEPAPLVLGEGDRLGNGSFFDQVEEFADLTVVALIGPPELGEQRRRDRVQDFAFKEQWVKSRVTKVDRLKPRARVLLNAANPPELLADELAELLK